MSQFDDALKDGLEAHEDATRARKEIHQTFSELSAAVRRQTNDRVFVIAGRVDRNHALADLAAMFQRGAAFVANQLPDPEEPDALFAVRRGGDRGARAQLCRLSLGLHGYPVEITIAGSFLNAHDHESLTVALVDLLRHPDVAGKIARVTALPGTETPQPALPASSSPEEAAEVGVTPRTSEGEEKG